MRLGIIQYLNALPLFYALQNRKVRTNAKLIAGAPSALSRQLRKGALDAASISTAEYLRHRELYVQLTDLGIGAQGQVMSVSLYLRSTPEQLRKVALTDQSLTSQLLVKVLCRHFWHVTPRFILSQKPWEEQECDGFLLIGDQCLERPRIEGYRTLDLASEWYKHTGLPFLFGSIAAWHKTSEEKRQSLAHDINASFAWAERHWGSIIQAAHDRSGLPKERLCTYYSLLRYKIDPQMKKGAALFKRLI